MKLAFASLAVLAIGAVFQTAQAPKPIKSVLIAPAKGGGMAPCEPSICVSWKDQNIVVSGVILDRAQYSSDAGKTWGDVTLKSPLGVHGDPTIITDVDGNFYYFHLSNTGGDGWIDRIVCQKSTDGGKTWTDGVGIGHNPPADQDKQWATSHPEKPWIYTTWTQFDQYGSRDAKHKSNIMFSMSQDGAASFSPAVRINEVSGDCLDGDNTTEGAVPAVDRNGNIYVAWSNREVIYFDKSSDNGKTWLAKDIEAARHVGGWDMLIPGINRCNGMPVLVVDNSKTKTAGNLYILFADQRFGDHDTDIFLVKSTDKGATWSKPARVNKDPSGKHQFFPWLAVDQVTGYLYSVYYDRRESEGSDTDVYVAYSTDAGATWTEKRVSDRPFLPRSSTFMGDYNNISAHNGTIAAIWGRMDNSATTVWGAVFKHADIVAAK